MTKPMNTQALALDGYPCQPRIAMDHPDSAMANTAFIQALTTLFSALNQAGIYYCHWKSNVRLEKALNGATDLDLLVDERQRPLFCQILEEHGLKPLQAPKGKDYPGIENYLGLDQPSGKLFHLHVHYQLVLGEQFVKNYHLPLEAHFLASTQTRYGVRVPDPTLEFIVFSMRALLKYRDRDGIKDLLSICSPGLPAAVVQEAHWLLEQTSLAQVTKTIQDLGALIPGRIVLDFIRTLQDAPRNGSQLLRLRARLRRALYKYQRHNRLRASLLYFRELWLRQKSFPRMKPSRKMSSLQGGRTLALVGADGAGKSTLSRLLHQWLAWKLDVRLLYLGSKQASWISKLAYLLFRGLRASHRVSTRLSGESSLPTRSLAAMRQAMLYSHYLSVGRDRLRTFRSGQNRAATGTLVIFDRFPLAASLDGPKIRTNGDQSRLAHLFARWEANLYQQISATDTTILLDVSPAVALQRKPDHDRAAIETKHQVLQEILDAKNGEEDFVRLDADQPFAEVALALKKAVWQVI